MGQRAVAFWCLTLLWMISAANAEAQSNDRYYELKSQGWFWRERLLVVEPDQGNLSDDALASESGPKLPAVEPLPMSAEWLRLKLPEFRDRAIDEPTPENLRSYLYLQREAMDRAERFAVAAQRVVLSDPMLDENNRRPLSTYGAQVFDAIARENTQRVAAKIASMAGVWYFFRSDCPFCHAQNPVLERLRERIGLVVLPISLDGEGMASNALREFVPNRGHAEGLGVNQTPTLYLVRKPREFVLLSKGLVTDDDLLERMIVVGHQAGWITDEEFSSTRAMKEIAALGSASGLRTANSSLHHHQQATVAGKTIVRFPEDLRPIILEKTTADVSQSFKDGQMQLSDSQSQQP